MKTINTKESGFSSNTYRIPAATEGCNVDRWYDKHTRNWVVQYMDAENNQVGSADYCGDKAGAINAAAEMAKKTVKQMAY